MAGQADHLSRLMTSRLDRAVASGLQWVAQNPNQRFDITLKVTIQGSDIFHRLQTSQGDMTDMPSGRVAMGQLILPEVDPEFNAAKYQLKLDEADLAQLSLADLPRPELTTAG